MTNLNEQVHLKPMDVYADITIPFDVAAYCRGHRFCIEAVALTKAIKDKDSARSAVEVAERWLAAAEKKVDDAVTAARTRMDADKHV